MNDLEYFVDWYTVDVDTETEEELAAIVKELRNNAPHTRWMIRKQEYETLTDIYRIYKTLAQFSLLNLTK